MKPLTSTRTFQVIASAALAPLVFLQSACASSAEPPPNIITVQVNTVRADDLRQEVSLSPQEVREATARMMAASDTQDVIQAAVSRLNNVTHRTSQRSLQQLTAMLSTLVTSPEASASFLQKLGGKALLERTSTAFSLSWASDDPGAELARSLAATLHVGEPQLALRNAADSQTLAKGVTSQLLEEITNGIGSSSTPHALSLLLNNSTLSIFFLDPIGTDLENADLLLQSMGREWRQLAGSGNATPIPAELRANSFDPGVALMTTLSQNPKTAFDFFKTPDDLTFRYYSLTTSHQIHWIQNRQWSHDQFTSLMAALEAAVSGNQQKPVTEETEAESKESARRASMTSTIIELLGNRAFGYETISEKEGNKRKERTDYFKKNSKQETLSPETLSSSAAINLAKIIFTYPQSMDNTLERSRDYATVDNSFAGKYLNREIAGDYTWISSPIISRSYLSWIFTTILSNKDGKAHLFQEVEKYQEQRVRARAKINPHPEKKANAVSDEEEREAYLMRADREMQVFLWERAFRVEAKEAREKDSRTKTMIEAPCLILGIAPLALFSQEDPIGELTENLFPISEETQASSSRKKEEVIQRETVIKLLGIHPISIFSSTKIIPKDREESKIWLEIIGISPLHSLLSNSVFAISKAPTSKFIRFEKEFIETKEEIKLNLPRKRTAELLRSFFNNKIIGMRDVYALAAEMDDDKRTVDSWFNNGQFPSEEEIAENYDLQSFLRELGLRTLKDNYYESKIDWSD